MASTITGSSVVKFPEFKKGSCTHSRFSPVGQAKSATDAEWLVLRGNTA
ncbi:hypothetical protein [Arsenicibacter rosenii]|nr:hypothetical protein [Arsenicibacter rosenii]